jgi:hypothetical protein
MAEFDSDLLREQRKLEEKQARDPVPGRGPGGGGTGGGGGEGGEGEGAEGARGGSAGGAGQAAPADAAGGKDKGVARTADTGSGGSHAGRGDGGTPVTAPREGGGAGGEDGSRVPADVGDGKDDDVVARQLREAAMKEEDPGVREKLWQEYRDYKKGAGKD